jgi:hypothetical protein
MSGISNNGVIIILDIIAITIVFVSPALAGSERLCIRLLLKNTKSLK